MKEDIILVNKHDEQVGVGYKMPIHKEGKLHRAFSIFIFNDKNKLMLQKRASTKYHNPSLWTNTCCSHPYPEENIIDAASRRLKEEMGFECDLNEIFSFKYKINFDNGLTENEFDHVLVGKYNHEPKLNDKEASDWKWISIEDLREDIKKDSDNYTHWLRLCLDRVEYFLKNN